MEFLIEIIDLSKSYFRKNQEENIVIKNLCMKFKSEKIYCFMGGSGYGKSTLLNLLSGTEKATEGKIIYKYNGNQNDIPKVNIMFQKDMLFPWKNVWKNLEMALYKSNISKNERAHVIEYYLRKFKMIETAYLYPAQLSQGMYARIALIRTLITEPDIVMLDEAFGSLDILTKHNVQTIFLELQKEQAFTSILISHDIDEAIKLADYIVVFNRRPIDSYYLIKNEAKIKGNKYSDVYSEVYDALEKINKNIK